MIDNGKDRLSKLGTKIRFAENKSAVYETKIANHAICTDIPGKFLRHFSECHHEFVRFTLVRVPHFTLICKFFSCPKQKVPFCDERLVLKCNGLVLFVV